MNHTLLKALISAGIDPQEAVKLASTNTSSKAKARKGKKSRKTTAPAVATEDEAKALDGRVVAFEHRFQKRTGKATIVVGFMNATWTADGKKQWDFVPSPKGRTYIRLDGEKHFRLDRVRGLKAA